MLITPIVVLAVSSRFEDYHWSVYSSLGLSLGLSLVITGKKIGQAHLYYLMLITPIVALAVSSLFEDYNGSVYSTLGLSLVISGNLLAQLKPQAYNKLKTVIKKQQSGLKSR